MTPLTGVPDHSSHENASFIHPPDRSQLVAAPIFPSVSPALKDPIAVELWLAQLGVDPVVGPAEPVGQAGGGGNVRRVQEQVATEVLGAGWAGIQPDGRRICTV